MPGWNNPESVQLVHSWLEGLSVLFFVGLVLFDVLAHLVKSKQELLERTALILFAIAVVLEVAAFPYSRQNDALGNLKIAELTKQASKSDENAKNLEAQIADSNFRVKNAEARVAQANAASRQAVAVVASADARIAEAEARAAEARSMAKGFEAQIAESKKEAAVAKLELAKLQERVSDRLFTPELRSKMMAVLARSPRFTIRFASPDGEPARYARQVLTAFDGWGVRAEGIGIATITSALYIDSFLREHAVIGAPWITCRATSNKGNVDLLVSAFKSAGIQVIKMEVARAEDDEIGVYFPHR